MHCSQVSFRSWSLSHSFFWFNLRIISKRFFEPCEKVSRDLEPLFSVSGAQLTRNSPEPMSSTRKSTCELHRVGMRVVLERWSMSGKRFGRAGNFKTRGESLCSCSQANEPLLYIHANERCPCRKAPLYFGQQTPVQCVSRHGRRISKVSPTSLHFGSSFGAFCRFQPAE